MAFVSQIPEESAGPELKAAYEEVRQSFGFVGEYFQALGREPEAIKRQVALGNELMRPGRLSTPLKARVTLVVSGINTSSYCVAAHLELLQKLGIERPLGRKLATDWERAAVPEQEKALFRYAAKLTTAPADVTAADLQAVLAAGWDEAAAVETALIVSWANFFNRVALGLGLMAEY